MSTLTTKDAINSVDIDVGGTFTDLVLTLDGERIIAKCPTTPHDLSIGFLNAIEAGGALLGMAFGTDLAARWGIRPTLDGAVALLALAAALAASATRQPAKAAP